MANVTRYSPLRGLERFSPFDDMERLFETMLRRPLTAGGTQAFGDIRVDVTEDANAYTVRADMPGVAKEDIKISVEGNQVSISAEVKKMTEEQGQNMLCCERFYGQQYRSFMLDNAVDETKADAKYENGVLELTLPKKSGTAMHQLKVH